jgi:phosphoglycerate dehydrogenase-like enzyme
MTRRLVADLRQSRPLWQVPQWALDEIRAALPREWEFIAVDAPADATHDGGMTSPEALAAVRGAEVYLGYGMPPQLLRAGEPSLRWVHSGSTGVGDSLHPEMLASPVLFTNSAGVHAEPIADTVLAMMLHFIRGLDWAVRAQAARRWEKEPWEAADAPLGEIEGTRVGLLGLGGIGAAVARRTVALGMRVSALRRRESLAAPAGVELLGGADALERLLAGSQHLVVSVPRTPQTRGMIGPRELALLPAGAVVLVVSRGGIVDEEALAAELASGRLRGAGLDVFAQEPLPTMSPLWTLPNTLLLPHVSGSTHRYWRRETDLIVENLRRYLRGDPLLNVVDRTAGY